jgi:hypothetical protein
MPLAYSIDRERRLVLITGEAVATPEEWFDMMAEAVADPRYKPGFDFLYDRTKVTHVPDAMYVRAWVFRHAQMMNKAGGGRLAVVVGEPVIYGMIRMASVYAERAGASVAVFWSEREALEWLGRDSTSSVA